MSAKIARFIPDTCSDSSDLCSRCSCSIQPIRNRRRPADPSDYDGDTLTDIAIWRPSVGEWWVLNSSTNETYAAAFGTMWDRIVPGDYTGDGRTDLAFFRPTNGSWYILRSENQSYFSAPFGTSSDQPVPGDYDADGRYDTAVFRPSTAAWYVDKSSGGTIALPLGQSSDQPLPYVFVR